MKEMEFTGKIIRRGNTSYYELKFNGFEFCHDFIWLFVEDWKRGSRQAWGYYGTAPKGLAIMMLGISVCHQGHGPFCASSNAGWTGHPHYHWIGCYNGWRSYKATTLKLYDQFAKEVIAHLPDEWTMTTGEIKQWVRKQQTKQRKYGKSKETNREKGSPRRKPVRRKHQ